ncbi:GPI-anchored protein LLG1 [Lycium ferocissimum]|uniref:GPI-anchored protein LLG1 n=1 Tax=Lycium ferocissimum TaxID=112874 RepID=UPI0028154B84|nr:GPI-anchored protein LLG1 [Lycium ferocissimum]
MELKHCFSCIFLLFSFSILAGVSASASLSDGIFVNEASTGRNLLQAKKPCPMSFEFQNYTVVTSQCRGPQYPAKQCCAALAEFACPFADDLNDLSNDCASTMFSYINLRGKYPTGLFASLCKGDKNGLACPGLAPSASANANNSHMSCRLSPVLMIATAFMGLLLLLL